MGFGGIGIWQLVIILVIVVMLFGTKKLRNLGSDLGGALKGFKSAMKDDENKDKNDTDATDDAEISSVETEAMKSEKDSDKK